LLLNNILFNTINTTGIRFPKTLYNQYYISFIISSDNNLTLKTPIVKAPALFLAFCLMAKASTAFPGGPFSDTTRSNITVRPEKPGDSLIVLKESNVEFPQIFSGNEQHTMDYIEKFSVNRKGYIERTYNRSKKIFPKVAAIFKKYDVPKEFQVLIALESGFNPNAVSSAGAVGYWQFMDDVAREYGLKIVPAAKKEKKKTPKADKTAKFEKKGSRKHMMVDERKDFKRSTIAAARYLRDRCRNLNNDWLLIAASYNWGVGNVWNAMERTGKKNPTFWDIIHYLPAETKTYVMNFITLNVVFNNYEKFSKNELQFKTITAKVTRPETPEIEWLSISL